MFRLASLAAFLAAAGCASIITGTSQQIAIATMPSGAKCVVSREGQAMAMVEPTPGMATVRKDKHDILVTCDKEGYQTATQYLHSGIEAGAFGNIIAGGLIGWGVDSATGADNKYPETTTLVMQAAPSGNMPTATSAQSEVSVSSGASSGSQQAPLVFAGCKFKDGKIAALPAQDCAAKGGTPF
jgi:hypothetical protein